MSHVINKIEVPHDKSNPLKETSRRHRLIRKLVSKDNLASRIT